MKIKKIGHCCLVIEHKGVRIMTDPGSFSSAQTDEKNIDLVLITHEHADHLHVESLKGILENSPHTKVITNSSVSKILEANDIAFELLENFDSTLFKDILLEAHEAKHEEIWGEFGQVQNTGYFIDKKLFYPGDAFSMPEKKVDILFCPVVAPWCRMREVLSYILKVNPKNVIPVHDAIPKDNIVGVFHNLPNKVCTENNIKFHPLKAGEETEIE